MSNEEDTFLMLKRIDIAEAANRLAAQYSGMKGAEIPKSVRYFTYLTTTSDWPELEKKRDDLLYGMGWTHAAFLEAYRVQSTVFGRLYAAEGVSK